MTGPAQVLFQQTYFELLKKALKPGGVICTQASFIWLEKCTPLNSYNNAKKVFGNAAVAYTVVPNYPTGQIGMVLATADVVRSKKSSPFRTFITRDEILLRKTMDVD